MPDRSKVRCQTNRDTGFTPRADGGGSLPGCVCSLDVPVRANQRRRDSGRGPHLFKRGWAGVSDTGGGDTVDLAPRAIAGAGLQVGFLVSRSQTLSSAHVSWAEFVIPTIFPTSPKNKVVWPKPTYDK